MIEINFLISLEKFIQTMYEIHICSIFLTLLEAYIDMTVMIITTIPMQLGRTNFCVAALNKLENMYF